MGWLDSPELVAASSSLGVAHSPGHPIPAMLGWLASLFPVGDVAFRVNLASALAGATAAGAVYLAAAELLRQISPNLSKLVRRTAAVGAALSFAACGAAWLQAVRAEVYSLQIALLAGTLAALLRYHRCDDGRWLALAGLLAGLGLANHHFMALLVVVPASVFVFARGAAKRPGASTIAATALLGVLGVAALLYLPVRSSQHPEVDWAAPHTADRFAWTVSARAFQKSATSKFATSRSQAARQATMAVVENTSEVLVVAAFIGLALAFRRRRHRAVLCLLAAVTVTTIAARTLVGFDPAVPDHLAYLLPGILSAMLLGVAGLALVAEWLPLEAGDTAQRRVRTALVCLPAALVVLQVWRLDAGHGYRDGYAADALARWELDDLPPRSVVLLAYFQTSFRVEALRAVDHARPDVAILDRGLTYPGAAAEAKRRYPTLAPVIDAGITVTKPLPLTALRALARKRPVFVQLDPIGAGNQTAYLLPAGPYARLVPDPVQAGLRRAVELEDVAAAVALQRRLASDSPADRKPVTEAMLWNDYLRMRFYCRAERTTAAQAAYESARALAPADEQLAADAGRCGLTASAPK